MSVKIGLIGCGGISRYHANGYLKIPNEARVTAVCDVVEENRSRMASYVGGAQEYCDLAEMLAHADIDAVDVCLPHHLHRDAIVAAADAGKHVLCEKPLCLTLEQASEISEAVQRGGVTLMCAHNQLFYPSVQHARQLLEEGVLGRVYQVRTVDTFWNRGVSANAGWRGSRETMGGGELIDTGYHPTYLLLYLAQSEPVDVAAMLSSHALKIDGEDSAQVLVRFADGAIGNIVTSWAYDRPEGWWQFLVAGERGSMYRMGDNLHLVLRDSEPQVFEHPAVNSFEEETAAFVRCIAEGRTPIQTEADGARVLEVILAAYRSEEERRIVQIRQPTD
ncbi:MAG: Gfo/Idh/MocA family oxidoreductase [Chloroflexota bacterium]|nr:Gfo/Idh/MocA family oxidoreductase [Chloroflexota bacterium]